MNYLGRSSQFMLIEVFHLKLQKEIFETESDRRFFETVCLTDGLVLNWTFDALHV